MGSRLGARVTDVRHGPWRGLGWTLAIPATLRLRISDLLLEGAGDLSALRTQDLIDGNTLLFSLLG